MVFTCVEARSVCVDGARILISYAFTIDFTVPPRMYVSLYYEVVISVTFTHFKAGM